jgi:hypothetical protein
MSEESVQEYSGREKVRWKAKKEMMYDVENDLKEMDVRGWIKVARDRDAWKLIVKEAIVTHGP